MYTAIIDLSTIIFNNYRFFANIYHYYYLTTLYTVCYLDGMKYVNIRGLDDKTHQFIQIAARTANKTTKDFYMDAAVKEAEAVLGESLDKFRHKTS